MDNAFEHYSNMDLQVSENILHRYTFFLFFLRQRIRQEEHLFIGDAILHANCLLPASHLIEIAANEKD